MRLATASKSSRSLAKQVDRLCDACRLQCREYVLVQCTSDPADHAAAAQAASRARERLSRSASSAPETLPLSLPLASRSSRRSRSRHFVQRFSKTVQGLYRSLATSRASSGAANRLGSRLCVKELRLELLESLSHRRRLALPSDKSGALIQQIERPLQPQGAGRDAYDVFQRRGPDNSCSGCC
jgi:hypothetical protein